jgi:hypothetical protein
MLLKCYSCQRPHDLDKDPDIGVCVECGGWLTEDGDPAPSNPIADKLVEVFAETVARFRNGKQSSN